MIIAVIGSTSQDIELVASKLSNSQIQIIDTLELLRHLDRKTMGSLTTKDYHQKYLLKKLESEFGTVIVTGNIVLNEEICKWILKSDDGIVVIASRDSLENYDESTLKYTEKYWEDKASQRYNLEVRFKKTYERLSKVSDDEHLYLVDVSEKECMDSFESMTKWDFSSKFLDIENIIKLVNPRKDDDTMTMEESIKKAMRELGMEVDDSDTTSEKVEKKPSISKKKPEKIEKKFMNPPVTESKDKNDSTEEEESEQGDSIFVKVTDDTMALLIPEGIHLESQEISGMKFNVATVSLPDLSNRKLQELSVIIGETHSESVKRTPIISSKSKDKDEKKQPTKVVVVSGNLAELQEEKARLDAEIKKARSEGDTDTVNALRKQRRAVRNKINGLK